MSMLNLGGKNLREGGNDRINVPEVRKSLEKAEDCGSSYPDGAEAL